MKLKRILLDEICTPQFSKMISNANGTHDNYQRKLGPYTYDIPFEFHWFLNGWKLMGIASIPTNVPLGAVVLEQIIQQTIQEKQKKNRMKLDI